MSHENTPLIDLFREYRAGDITAFDDIISVEENYNRSGSFNYYKTNIRNTDLKRRVKYAYNWLKGNLVKSRFNSGLNEICSVFLCELIELVNDKEYIPKNNTELCKTLFRRAFKTINESLVNEEIVESLDNQLDEDDYSVNISDKETYQNWAKQHYNDSSGYIGLFRELLKIQSCVDINNIFPVNSDFQRNLIDLFKNDESAFFEDDGVLTVKSMKEISQLYNHRYGQLPTEEQIIQAMNTIYKRLMKCAAGYVYCTRKQFKGNKNDYKKKKPPKIKGCYCLKNVRQMLSYSVEQIIAEANEGESQVAGKEYGAAYDLLIESIRITADLLREKGFEPDLEKIIDIALFNYKKNEFWNFSEKSEKGFKIEYYNEISSGLYSLRRAKKIEYSSLPCCYLLGNCVIYADDESKTLTYLQKENRLFYVKKDNNQYKGYKTIC